MSDDSVKAGCGCLLSVVVIAAMIVLTLVYSGSRFEETITITGKDVKNTSESSTYMVFTDKGTYCVKDSLLFWRWDSSDMYGSLHEGGTYEIEAVGWRVPILSMYPNILEASDTEGGE